MTEKTLKLPDLGEGLHEAEIVEWHVAEGDRVEADQLLVSVETDKAVVEGAFALCRSCCQTVWRGR